MRAIVVRHFKTLINASGLIMGWGDAPRAHGWEADLTYVDAVLNEFGIEFSAIYTSYLERARQTGMFYARKRGIHLIRDTQALNEINYGVLYRKSKSWVEKTIPQHKKDPEFVYPGGESFAQMRARSVEFFDTLVSKHRTETILVVVHAGVIRGFICHYLGLPYAQNLKREIGHRYIGDFGFDNCQCVSYNELGKPSGFVRDDVVSIPFETGKVPVAANS